MLEKKKHVLLIIEAFFILVGLAFFITESIMYLVEEGNFSFHYAPSIITIVLDGMAVIIYLAMIPFLFKRDTDFMQPGYSYIINTVVVTFIMNASFYAFNINDLYFRQRNITSSELYAYLALPLVYLVLLPLTGRKKQFPGFRIIPYIPLLCAFAISIYIHWNIYHTVAASCFIVAVILIVTNLILDVIHYVKMDQTHANDSPSDNQNQHK